MTMTILARLTSTASGGTPAADRPAPWLTLAPRGTVEVRQPSTVDLRRLPPGTSVALVADGPLSAVRLRRRARAAGIRVERELVVVPTTRSPLVVLDDTEASVRHFWAAVAAVPPGLTWASAPATAALLVARVAPWRWTGLLMPGRVLLGRRG
jgi:hypothetical protein